MAIRDDRRAAYRDRFRTQPEPNEYLIQLLASVERLRWTPAEARRRDAYRSEWMPPDCSPEMRRALTESSL